jgi:hypothetical protein
MILVLAISGIRTKETMQLEIPIGGSSFLALLDSGSTHNFITEEAARRINLRLQPQQGMRVTIANGDRVASHDVYRATPCAIAGEHFTADFFALQLAGYDVFLGTRWLVSLGPILWDFSTLRMAFTHEGRPVCWQGLAGPPSLFMAVSDFTTLLQAVLSSRPCSPSHGDDTTALQGPPHHHSAGCRSSGRPSLPISGRTQRRARTLVRRHAGPGHHSAELINVLLPCVARQEGGRKLAVGGSAWTTGRSTPLP